MTETQRSGSSAAFPHARRRCAPGHIYPQAALGPGTIPEAPGLCAGSALVCAFSESENYVGAPVIHNLQTKPKHYGK